MIRRTFAIGTALLSLFAAASIHLGQQQPAKAVAAKTAAAPRTPPPAMSVEAQTELTKKYCVGCHNDKNKSGNMSLAELDLAHPEKNAVLAEKVIRKVRVGLMPAAGAPRPETETLRAFAESLEFQMDKTAALRPTPGSRPFQRLTRDEYARSVRDLLGIEIDVAKFLPADTVSGGFDNVADSQSFSATLMEGYMRAADRITRSALGDPKADATSEVYKIPRTASQMHHVEGTPIGTRGGVAVVYNFPADGEYNFRSLLHTTSVGTLFGNVPSEQLEVSVDGERVALMTVD